MNAGKLKKLITIQTRTETTDTYGGQVHTWATFATVWAAVSPMKGRELLAAQAAQSEMTTRFSIRYLAGVTQAMRISFGGKYYNILEVIDFDEQHVEMQLMATSGVNEG